jgi:WD40 repeat protein
MSELQKTAWRFDAGVVAAAISGGVAAVGQGDGRIRLIDLADPREATLKAVTAHQGSALALAPTATGFVSGGDDGRLIAVSRDGGVSEIAQWRGRQLDTLTVTSDGTIAVAVGRQIELFSGQGRRTLKDHPSSVAGLHSRGTLLAAAHYDGATLWDLADPAAEPRRLAWKGSHLAAALSPDGAVLCTSTQDGEVHGWHLAAAGEMRMSGYGAKVRSLSWSADGQWLAASGVPLLHCWPFDGPGPEGRAPLDLHDGGEVPTTAVACHPFLPLLAGGYADGTLVLGDTKAKGVRGEPIRVSKREITALAWAADGRALVVGAADGKALTMTLPLPVGLR